MILSGEKTEEYREIKPYYDSRFAKYESNMPFEVIFRNGYSAESPAIKCEVILTMNYGNPNWGAAIGEVYYVLKILSVEKLR